ncbi:FAD:protein FMN transferase [Ectobacillus panaciterrae]|uniref:FAD:protein FMN transferase n=1 Tax=Ectobacillus panaciterrae TaxID=363872 RepID=UPI00040F106F|nr:FAD:protein FMN transferase [Ectobacillus panaciterrae]
MQSNKRKKTYEKSVLYMGTIVCIKVVTSRSKVEVEERIIRAFETFRFVEGICSRFNEQSEIRRLSSQIGIPVQVSDILFEAIRFAWEAADLTEGVFDPTIGHMLEEYGFNLHYLTGEELVSSLSAVSPVSYRDVVLDEEKRTVLLSKPLLLDLGAVAKGLAVDLAVKELCDFEGFVIDAGGDIFAGGVNEREEPWVIGIRHPLRGEETICTVQLTDAAICTSGSYERISPVKENIHHLINPHLGISQSDIVSCTVIAPFAMMADVFSTVSFLLGAKKGAEQLQHVGLEGIWVTSSLDLHRTKGMEEYLYEHV